MNVRFFETLDESYVAVGATTETRPILSGAVRTEHRVLGRTARLRGFPRSELHSNRAGGQAARQPVARIEKQLQSIPDWGNGETENHILMAKPGQFQVSNTVQEK